MQSIEVPFINLMHEAYARDISSKTRASLTAKCKQGLYVGAKAPYGYLKDPLNINKLIVDTNY